MASVKMLMNPETMPPTVAQDAARAASELVPEGVREMTLDDALQLAVRMHREERLEGARTLYERILQAMPGHADALSLLGMLEHQIGRHERAQQLLREAVARVPDFPGYQLNLGNALVETDHLEEALVVYRRAAELDPGVADVHNNLGALYRVLKRADEAKASYRRAIELDPRHVRAWNNLGLLHDDAGEVEESIRCYLTAIELIPENGMSAYLLGMTLYKLGQITKATEVFRQWMERAPDDPRPAHLYAACSGRNVPTRAPDAYIEAEFDSFAASFERVLNGKLDYRAPQLCATAFAEELGPAQKTLDVADIGCGTGLCGPLVAPWARQLVGVDLSAGMLTRARAKGVYDQLVKAELTAFLRSTPQSWDAMVCADTLCYFGDLGEAMRAASTALRPGGLLVFTVEADDEDAFEGARILPSGRYAHGRAHLERAIAGAGLALRHARREPLRREGAAIVQGWLMTVARAS